MAAAKLLAKALEVFNAAVCLLEHHNVVAIQELKQVFSFLGGKGGALGEKASRVPRSHTKSLERTW